MPNIKSAKKRARQNLTRRMRNKSILSAVRTLEKKLLKAISSETRVPAEELLRTYTSKISKAKSKGVLKAKTASRKISRLAIKVFKTKQASTG